MPYNLQRVDVILSVTVDLDAWQDAYGDTDGIPAKLTATLADAARERFMIAYSCEGARLTGTSVRVL